MPCGRCEEGDARNPRDRWKLFQQRVSCPAIAFSARRMALNYAHGAAPGLVIGGEVCVVSIDSTRDEVAQHAERRSVQKRRAYDL